MKKLLIGIQILINIIIVFFVPIVPGIFIAGMQSNGHVYTKKIYSSIFNVFVKKRSIIRLDANYSFNDKILIIEIIALIIINVLFYLYYKRDNINKINLKTK